MTTLLASLVGYVVCHAMPYIIAQSVLSGGIIEQKWPPPVAAGEGPILLLPSVAAATPLPLLFFLASSP